MKKNRVKRDDMAQGGVGAERKLEIDCCTYARQRGIIAVKLEKNAHKGIPDYMFIAEGGRAMFVEFKRPDGKGVASNEQKYWAKFLGYSHRFIDNFEDFKERLDDFFVLGEADVVCSCYLCGKSIEQPEEQLDMYGETVCQSCWDYEMYQAFQNGGGM